MTHSLSRQRLDKDLHTSTQTKNKVERRLFLNVVVRKSSSVFQLLSSENQPLLVWRDTFLVLDLGFDIVDGVRGFNLESDGFTREAGRIEESELARHAHAHTQRQRLRM